MNKDQLRRLIKDVLGDVGLCSPAAVELLMMTAATESKLGYYVRQVRGPARGIFQMEPNTEGDIHKNYLKYHEVLADRVSSFSTGKPDELEWNLAYQILMARVHYLRVSEALPNVNDTRGLAGYYKKYYNTYLGAGTASKAMKDYRKYAI